LIFSGFLFCFEKEKIWIALRAASEVLRHLKIEFEGLANFIEFETECRTLNALFVVSLFLLCATTN
jgi:hypothetical protein